MDKLLLAFKKMILIRITEQEIANLYLKNKIMSFVHFYVGQEAVAVGVCDALDSKDKVFGNHRSHGHYLAKGGDLKKMICELLGKENGLAKGKGGSMHMIDKSIGFVGSTPILGSVTPIAAGSAFKQMYTKNGEISVGFIGDGASEEGIVYETINLAALFKLPFLLVIENNLYSVATKINERRGEKHSVEGIVNGFGVRYLKADGNDYEDVLKKAKILVDELRSGGGPAVLECIVYRHMAHSAPIFDEGCRGEDVLEKRLEKDSLKKLRQTLVDGGIAEGELNDIENSTLKTVLESIQFAVDSKYPVKESLYTDLYA